MAAPEPFDPLITKAELIRRLAPLFGGKLHPDTVDRFCLNGMDCAAETVPGFKRPRWSYRKAVAWIQSNLRPDAAGSIKRGPGRPRKAQGAA